jgi:hypothetical protein
VEYTAVWRAGSRSRSVHAMCDVVCSFPLAAPGRAGARSSSSYDHPIYRDLATAAAIQPSKLRQAREDEMQVEFKTHL